MDNKLLQGTLVTLRGLVEGDREQIARWKNDPELKRLTGPAAFTPVPPQDVVLEDDKTTIQFAICEAGEETIIGWLALTHISWSNRTAELSIYIGHSSNHGKQLGSDSIDTLLRFAFNELNLHRVELEVVGYNELAIKTYRKLGFTQEGAKREYGERDGKRYDLLQFGLLAKEFREMN